MLAGAHRVLRIVTGRQGVSEQAGTLGELPGMRRRRAWARSVHHTLAAAGALGDERQPVSAAALRQLKRFLTDPSASPLYGDDSATARRAAQQLQRSFTGHPEP
jgi:hypothetical protein